MQTDTKNVNAALVHLLIAKGVFTAEEFAAALSDAERTGGWINLVVGAPPVRKP